MLGLGDTDDPQPNLVFDTEIDEDDDKKIIEITSGDSEADADRVEFSGANDSAVWGDLAGLGAGESITAVSDSNGEDGELEIDDADEELTLIWDGDDIITEFNVSVANDS